MTPLATLAPIQNTQNELVPRIALLEKGILEREVQENYFADSELYFMKSGFEIEFIHKPRLKSIGEDLRIQITKDLGDVLLKAFNKDENSGKELVTEDRIAELALNTDVLLVARKNGVPIAFHSGSLIEPWLYYSKATFVDPSEQNAGLGLISIFLAAQKAVISKLGSGSVPWVVTRSRNFMVARMVENGCEYYNMSTERQLDDFSLNVFRMTAKYLGNDFDPNTGIVKNAYLPGIPQGPRPKDERIKTAMEVLGPCDACYIAGKMNSKRVNMIINKYVSQMTNNQVEDALVA